MTNTLKAALKKAKKAPTWLTTPDLVRLAERLSGQIVDQVESLLRDMNAADAGTNAVGACWRAQWALVGVFVTVRELRAQTTGAAFGALQAGCKRLDEIAASYPEPATPGRLAKYALDPAGLAVHPWVGPPVPGLHDQQNPKPRPADDTRRAEMLALLRELLEAERREQTAPKDGPHDQGERPPASTP